MKFCGNCGASVEGMSVCAQCGNRVVATAPAARAAAVPQGEYDQGPTEAPPAPLGWPTAVAPESGDYSAEHFTELPAPPGANPRRKYWWITLGALVVLLAGAAAVAYTVYFSKTGGAETPEAAVTELAEAINEKDLIRAALLLPPNELQGLRDSFAAAGEAAVRTDLAEPGQLLRR